jgi:polyisoprenoid-binding protein YceI
MRVGAFELVIVGIVSLVPGLLHAQNKPIDVNRSTLTIRVYKSGVFSAFAHNHEIRAQIHEGEIDSSPNPKVNLRVDSGKMRVLDPDISEDDRAKIQHTMLGPAVLDAEHFPDISYRSTTIRQSGDAHWEVRGNLTLHGTSQPTLNQFYGVGSSPLPAFATANKAAIPRQLQFSVDFEF